MSEEETYYCEECKRDCEYLIRGQREEISSLRAENERLQMFAVSNIALRAKLKICEEALEKIFTGAVHTQFEDVYTCNCAEDAARVALRKMRGEG